MKDVTHDRIDDWDEELDENGKRIHTVNYVQFMRMESEDDPWSLVEMIPKVNIVVEYPEPKRYMLPPRKGWFDPKRHYPEWEDGPEPYLKETVWWARQAGCDTVIAVVPGTAIQCLADAAGYSSDLATPPCCVATVVADFVGDNRGDVEWTVHSFAADGSDISIPPFQGNVDEIVHPHEGKDPDAAPENRWAAFPEPEPEVIPSDYPDLPPFSQCLDVPLPDIPRKKPVQPKQKKGGKKPPKERAKKPSKKKA